MALWLTFFFQLKEGLCLAKHHVQLYLISTVCADLSSGPLHLLAKFENNTYFTENKQIYDYLAPK